MCYNYNKYCQSDKKKISFEPVMAGLFSFPGILSRYLSPVPALQFFKNEQQYNCPVKKPGVLNLQNHLSCFPIKTGGSICATHL
ncbi:MAG: hypothetical protein DRH32_09740 [Deltaproteobacteria bacterium]|nr:MAG: hypothetical protein DRH32_09740 [Deltaproteobacteria bacterium]